MSKSGIDRRVESGAWTGHEPGVYSITKLHEPWLTEVSATIVALDGAAMGPTGGALWQLDGFDKYAGTIQVITEKQRYVKDKSVVVHRATWIEPRHFTIRRGVRVLQPAPLLASLGELTTIDEVEGAMDHVLRMKWATWAELAKASTAAYRFRKGAPMLREAVERRSPQRQHTDSLLETRGYQVLRNAGLPAPVLQFPVRDGSRVIAHADLAYPEHNLLIETVGVKAHRSSLAQYSLDCRRSNRVNLLKQYTILQYTWEQVTKDPHKMVAEVMRAMGIARQTILDVRERKGGRPILLPPELF